MNSKSKLVKSGAEWDSNNSSPVCILCTSTFSVFRNRRHHCRQCGRLVCENCSTRKMKLDSTKHQSKELQRVCDPCYLMLTKKEEKKTEHVFLKEKYDELLMTTSMISDSLIDVYFLDGSYKTVCYDDATTISELAANICFTVKIALFEVLQDINDPKQFRMLKPGALITEVLEKWREARVKYAKIVIPLFDLQSSFPNFATDGFKPAIKRVMPSVPMDHHVGNTDDGSGDATVQGAHYNNDQSNIDSAAAENVVSSEVIRIRSVPQTSAVDNSRFEDDASSAGNSSRSASVNTATDTNLLSNSTGVVDSHVSAPLSPSPNRNASAAVPVSSPTRASLSSLHLHGGRKSDSQDAEVKKIKVELETLKERLDKATKQNDMLRALCLKTGRATSYSDVSSVASDDHTDRSHFHSHSGESGGPPILFKDQASKENTYDDAHHHPHQLKKSEKRSSFNWTTMGFSTGSTTSSSATLHRTNSGGAASSSSGGSHVPHSPVVTGGNNAISGSHNNSTHNNSSFLSPLTLANSSGGIRKSTSSATFAALQSHIIRTNSMAHTTPRSTSTANRDSFYLNRGSELSRASMASECLTEFDFNLEPSKVCEESDELLQDPLKVLRLPDNQFTLFVRTYYHKINELEMFCNKYDKILNALLQYEEPTASSGSSCGEGGLGGASEDYGQAVSLSRCNSQGDEDDECDGDNTGKLSSKALVHLYHMVVAADSVYEFLMTDFEAWRSNMKQWLLKNFAESVRLPVLRPESLKAAIYCLLKEQLMFEPVVIDIIKAAIDNALEVGIEVLRSNSGRIADGALSTGQKESQLVVLPQPLAQKNLEETFARTTALPPTMRSSFASTGSNNSGNNTSGNNLGAKYNFTQMSQYMDNVVRTFNYIIGDLIHTIPEDILVLAIFLAKAGRIIREEVKLPYYTHKSVMLNSELMAIYRFLGTLIKLFTKFAVDKDLCENLSELLADVFKQYHATTSAFLNSAVQRIYSHDERLLAHFQQKVHPEDSAYDPSGGDHHSSICSGDSASKEYYTVWASELALLVKTQLQLIPTEVAGGVKVFLSLQVLDCLSDFSAKEQHYLSTLSNAPKYLLDKLCVFINNHHCFSYQLSEAVEAWAYDLEDVFMEKIAEKLDASLGLFRDCALAAVETVNRVVYTDIQEIFSNERLGLFNKTWENSVKSITLLKASLRKHLGFVCSYLSLEYAGGLETKHRIILCACESVVALYVEQLLCCVTMSFNTGGPSSSADMAVPCNIIERLSEDVEMLTKLFEEIRVTRLLDEHCVQQPIVYTTASSNTPTSTGSTNKNSRGRLFRFSTKATPAAHNTSSGSINSHHSTNFNTGTGVQGILKSSSSYGDLRKLDLGSSGSGSSSANTSGKGDNCTRPTSPDNSNNSNSAAAAASLAVTTHTNTNKNKLNDILKPLAHLVLACQMDADYLVDFVKSELYADFGVHCVAVWQLIMHWRGHDKGSVASLYEQHFSSWEPRKKTEPLLPLSCLGRIKHVSFLKGL